MLAPQGVKAHKDVYGNEAADRLAKAGAELDVVNANIDVPPIFGKHFLAQKILSTWQNRWDEEYRGRSVFLYYQGFLRDVHDLLLSTGHLQYTGPSLLATAVSKSGISLVRAHFAHPLIRLPVNIYW